MIFISGVVQAVSAGPFELEIASSMLVSFDQRLFRLFFDPRSCNTRKKQSTDEGRGIKGAHQGPQVYE